jgi:sodium-dependent dicarboxylate transporter 2/3/5
MALVLGIFILLLPRPEGTKFKISGDPDRSFYETIGDRFELLSDGVTDKDTYTVKGSKPTNAEKGLDTTLMAQAERYGNGVPSTMWTGFRPKPSGFWPC